MSPSRRAIETGLACSIGDENADRAPVVPDFTNGMNEEVLHTTQYSDQIVVLSLLSPFALFRRHPEDVSALEFGDQ